MSNEKKLNPFMEIMLRTKDSDKFVYCAKCKTGTKSLDGECIICL